MAAAQPAKGKGPAPAANASQGPAGDPRLLPPWHPWYTAWWTGQPRHIQLAEQARIDSLTARDPDYHWQRDFYLERAARYKKESERCSPSPGSPASSADVPF